jgi:hypothetical protein
MSHKDSGPGRSYLSKCQPGFLAERPCREDGAGVFSVFGCAIHVAEIRLAYREGEVNCTFGQNRDGDQHPVRNEWGAPDP